jgi:hypothetical protein
MHRERGAAGVGKEGARGSEQSAPSTGLKKKEGDTWASSGVNLSERKIVGRLLNASSFSDLSYSPLQSCSVHASRKIRFGLILCPSFPPPYSNAKN